MDGEVIRGRWSENDPLPPEDWAALLPSRTDTDALYRREADRLRRFFRRRLPGEDAFDHVHDVFRKWIDAAGDALRPEAYLTTMAKNVVRATARDARARDVAVAGLEDVGEARTADPHDALEARDMLARVDAAIATLKPKTRRIFLMHRLDGLDYAEIAARMELSVKAVEWHIGNALDHIRRRVGRP